MSSHPIRSTTTSPRHRFSRAAVITLTLTTLAACATDSPNPADDLGEVSIADFTDVRATLDFDTGIAVTPIDDYLTNVDFQTEVLFTQAHEALVTVCMAEAGHTFTGLTSIDWSALLPMEDRTFGLWNRASAAVRGSDLDRSRGVPKGNTTVKEGVAFNQALDVCDESAQSDATLGRLTEELMQGTLADRIMGQSITLAEHSDAGKAVTSRFTKCLEDKSLVVDPESGYVSSEYSDIGVEADITASVGEVDCNIDTGRIQALYDLTAQYEAAYMNKYEAQLGSVLAHKRELHAQLQDIIDSAS